jgi:hypothetical protein
VEVQIGGETSVKINIDCFGDRCSNVSHDTEVSEMAGCGLENQDSIPAGTKLRVSLLCHIRACLKAFPFSRLVVTGCRTAGA